MIGSDGAGLRAAIEAARSRRKTAIINKGKISRSGATLLAGANISAIPKNKIPQMYPWMDK